MKRSQFNFILCPLWLLVAQGTKTEWVAVFIALVALSFAIIGAIYQHAGE